MSPQLLYNNSIKGNDATEPVGAGHFEMNQWDHDMERSSLECLECPGNLTWVDGMFQMYRELQKKLVE